MTLSAALPSIIQGGMGVAVSNWRLARAVASLGRMGVVSGEALIAGVPAVSGVAVLIPR